MTKRMMMTAELMGINSDWVKILKEECPDAFTPKCPTRPRAAFIDGQIQLQKSNAVNTWDQFVYCQFTCPIRRMFVRPRIPPPVTAATCTDARPRPQKDHGVSVVVLAFDSYALVPRAKAATQVRPRR